MNEALVPLYVMSVFLVLMGLLVWLAVRRARRGFAFTETTDHGAEPGPADDGTGRSRSRRSTGRVGKGVGLDGLDDLDGS